MNIRDATKDDVKDLAILINLAGEGLPMFLWRQMAEQGQDPLTLGAIRAARDEGLFSYRNARVFEIDGLVAGMMLGYLLPDPYDVGEPGDYPAAVWPLVLQQPFDQIRPALSLPTICWQAGKPGDIVRAGIHAAIQVLYQLTGLSFQVHSGLQQSFTKC